MIQNNTRIAAFERFLSYIGLHYPKSFFRNKVFAIFFITCEPLLQGKDDRDFL